MCTLLRVKGLGSGALPEVGRQPEKPLLGTETKDCKRPCCGEGSEGKPTSLRAVTQSADR